ncbi:hypothetical protein THAOC_00186, partial [Thalassiosira oceanica]
QAQVEQHQAQVDEVKAECREKCDSLERRCGVLEARCGSLERSIQVLKKDIGWTYKAPGIPRSHWIEQGRSEEYADNMEDFLRAIKSEVEDIRKRGEGWSCSCLNNADAPHSEVLLPHFKELADAIQVSSGAEGNIYIDNIELHTKVIKQLFSAMEGRVTTLYVESMAFPAEDVAECYEIIAGSVRSNHALERLTWFGNRIPSDDQADLFIESIIDNRSITNLDLDFCFHQSEANGCRALVTLMTCGRPFESIHFGGNGLSGIDDVAAALATNPQLGELYLDENELNDRDAELIAHALKHNTNLLGLHLRGNDITSAGFERLRNALYDPSSLNAMESCNHTCWVDCVEENDHYVGGNYNDMTPQQRRHRKLYALLSTRHAECSNARRFNAELGEGPYTLELVPEVLDCIQRLSADRSAYAPLPLSLVFELVESWKMPELCGRR